MFYFKAAVLLRLFSLTDYLCDADTHLSVVTSQEMAETHERCFAAIVLFFS